MVALAKQKKAEAAEKAEEDKEEEKRVLSKKVADAATAKAAQSLKAADEALSSAKTMAIASKLPSENPLATPESQGKVKAITQDPTKATSATETPAPVMKVGALSKDLIHSAGKSRLQYKVPKKSEDFAFASADEVGSNEARTRSSIQLINKTD